MTTGGLLGSSSSTMVTVAVKGVAEEHVVIFVRVQSEGHLAVRGVIVLVAS